MDAATDEHKLRRDREVAAMALGEDAHLVGGTDCDAAFRDVSDASRCGKLAALDELLALWHAPQAGARNKVQLGCQVPMSRSRIEGCAG